MIERRQLLSRLAPPRKEMSPGNAITFATGELRHLLISNVYIDNIILRPCFRLEQTVTGVY